jgi:hypothetical protein
MGKGTNIIRMVMGREASVIRIQGRGTFHQTPMETGNETKEQREAKVGKRRCRSDGCASYLDLIQPLGPTSLKLWVLKLPYLRLKKLGKENDVRCEFRTSRMPGDSGRLM